MQSAKVIHYNATLFDPKDPKIPSWERTWSKGVVSTAYDSICLTSEEVNILINELEIDTHHTGYELLSQPSLPYFTLFVSQAPCDEIRISFTPSVLPPNQINVDHMLIHNKPYIDAYIYMNRVDGSPDKVVTISTDIITNEKGDITTGTLNGGVWQHKDCVLTPTPEVVEWERGIKYAYLAIQNALYNRPTIFKSAVRRTEIVPNNEYKRKGKKTNKRRKVKTYRVITIDREQLMAIPSKIKRPISCESWGVIGHYRHYKNGKTVFIKPYKKGKKRSTEGKYSAKVYELANVKKEQSYGLPC